MVKDKKNIVLIGFMGAGKTTVGRQLAFRLQRDFIDTDKMVEEITGMTISQIFHKYGEVRFRAEEKLAIRKVSSLESKVIAVGGGAVLDRDNVVSLKQNGIFVWLKPQKTEIYQRLKSKTNRPLLKGKSEEKEKVISALLTQREPYYKAVADLEIDTAGKKIEEIANEIISLLKLEAG